MPAISNDLATIVRESPPHMRAAGGLKRKYEELRVLQLSELRAMRLLAARSRRRCRRRHRLRADEAAAARQQEQLNGGQHVGGKARWETFVGQLLGVRRQDDALEEGLAHHDLRRHYRRLGAAE